MKTINKIMVAVDFSNYSLPAVRYATHLARDVNAALRLVNVIQQRDVDLMKRIASLAPAFSFKDYLEETRQDRQARFEQILVAAGCEKDTVKTLICIGIPHQELLRVIDVKKPDLLIMATKGRSNLADALIGSCAQKMFRYSPVPVLSIRGDGTAA